MKIVGFDIEISNVFDLRPGEDIDKYAPFDVAVAATQIHGGEHRLWFSTDAGGYGPFATLRAPVALLRSQAARKDVKSWESCL